jgi:S1-C subfamily serine protease
MNMWKKLALPTALLGLAGLGVAFAPVAHGQATTPKVVAPKAVRLFSGGGSHIGVSIREVEEEDLKTAKLSTAAGVVIEEVAASSPAEKAGVKKGDVVLEFDGERVRSTSQFTRLVQETPSGRKVQMAVMRVGQKTTLTVEPSDDTSFPFSFATRNSILQDFAFTPPKPPTPPPAPAMPNFDTWVFRTGSGLGIGVGDLSPQLGDYFGTKSGVLVTSVVDDSAAAKAGLKAGDVITSFNGATVDTPAELRRRVQRIEDGEEFTITIVRDKKPTTLKGKVEPQRNRRVVRSIV